MSRLQDTIDAQREANRDIRGQFSTLRQNLKDDRSKTLRELAEQRRIAEGEVRREADTARRKVLNQRSIVDRQRLEVLQKIRTIEQIEQRKRSLPITKPSDLRSAIKIDALNKKAQALKQQLYSITRDIKTAKAEALADIKAQADKITKEVNQLTSEALRQMQILEAEALSQVAGYAPAEDYIKVGKGDTEGYIDKSDYDNLSTEHQKLIKSLGVEHFNHHMNFLNVGVRILQSKREADIRTNYVEIAGGDYVTKADYDILPPKDQQILMADGIEAYNNYAKASARLAEKEATGVITKDASGDWVVVGTPSQRVEGDIFGIPVNPTFERGLIIVGEFFSPTEAETTGTYIQRFKATADRFTPIYSTVINWDKMATWEKGLSVALDVFIVGAIFSKPIGTGARAIIRNSLGKVKAPSLEIAYSNITKAIRSGKVSEIKTAGHNLEAIGKRLKAEGVKGGDDIIRQGQYLVREAETLAITSKQALPTSFTTNFDRVKASLDNMWKQERVKVGGRYVGWRGEVKLQPTPKPAPKILKQVREHPLTRQEFNTETKGLTPKQKTAIDNTTSTSRTEVMREISRYKANNKSWRDIETALERGRRISGKPPTPVKTKRLAPRITTADVLQQKREMARKWLEEVKQLKADAVVNRLSKLSLERQREILRILGNVMGKDKARQVRNVIIQRQINTITQRYLANPSTATASQALTQLKTAGLLNALFATSTGLGLRLMSSADTATATATLTALSTKVANAVKTGNTTAVKQLAITQAKTVSQPKITTATLVKPTVKVTTKTVTKPTVKAVKPIPKPKPKRKPRPTIKLPDGSTRQLTEKELLASVAWRQGLFYILLYPPYGEKNIIYSRTPFEGVKYHAGVGSAQRSLTQLQPGQLPPRIQRDMGIMDISITRGHRTLGGVKTKPRIRFRQDKGQRTKTTPSVSGFRRR